MKTYRHLLILFLFAFAVNFLTAQAPEAIPDELIICLDIQSDSEAWMGKALEERGGPITGKVIKTTGPNNTILLLKFDPSRTTMIDLEDELLNFPGVRSVEQNYVLQKRDVVPNDASYELQWSLPIIEIEEVWEVSTGGQTINGDEIVIAIIDSGFKWDHPDLIENIWVNESEANGTPGFDDDGNGLEDDIYGWNFDQDSPIHNSDSHGTAVAGILGARGNNLIGMTGINWNIKLMLLSVQSSFDIAQAYTYALDMRTAYNTSNGLEGAYVTVTNASLGINSRWCDEFPSWGELYDPLGEAGILNVSATANNNVNVEQEGDMPTSCPSEYLLTVTNTDRDDHKVLGAAYGTTSIDLGAPGGPGGDGAFTLYINDDYTENFGGTSASCPHVAGVAALLYSMPCEEIFAGTPGETVLLIKDALMKGVDPNEDLNGRTVTGGRLNASRSLAYLHSYCQEEQFDDFFDTYASEKSVVRMNSQENQIDILYSSDVFGRIDFHLFNVLGMEVYRQQVDLQAFDQQSFSISTSNLATGVYFLVIANGKDPITQKVWVY